MTNGNGNNLQSEYEFFSRWAERVAMLIIVGLIVEIAAVFILKKPLLEGALTIASAVLIVAGVWGELILERRAKRAGDGIVAEANARAAEAEAEIARITTPRARLLTPEATVSIIEAIKPFAGTPFTIGVPQVGREPWDLAWHLEPILPKAGWVFVDWAVMPGLRKVSPTKLQPWTYGIANVSNVAIEFLPKFADELTPAATALVDALNRIGIAAKVEPTPVSGISGRGNVIHLLIGAKE